MSTTQITKSYSVDGIEPTKVLIPKTAQELANTLKVNAEENVATIPFGNGTSMSVGNIPKRYKVAIDTTRIRTGFEHIPADMVCIVPAGLTFGSVNQDLAKSGQRLPFITDQEATIGGLLAANTQGRLKGRFGGQREWIIGIKVAMTNGCIVKSGGRVVKNVQGLDMHRLHVGAFGSLGIITEAAFKLIPLPEYKMSTIATFDDINAVYKMVRWLSKSNLLPEFIEVSADSTEVHNYQVIAEFTGIQRVVEQTVNTTKDEWQDKCTKFTLSKDTPHNNKEFTNLTCSVKSGLYILPSDVKICIERLFTFANTNSVRVLIHTDAIFGYLQARLFSDDLTLQRKFVILCFEISSKLNGHAIIENCSNPIKQEFDVFGKSPDTMPIIQKIKQQFDPHSILNHGRFIGRL